MNELIFYPLVFLASFILTYLIVPFNIKLSIISGVVDKPHDRGIHKKIMPLSGGLSFSLVILVVSFLTTYFVDSINYRNNVISTALGGFFIVVLGFADDKVKLSAFFKLTFQILIVIFLYYSGIKIDKITNPFGNDLILGNFSLPITILWFLLIINAINLIDGIDGMATGIAVIVNTVLFLVGVMYNNLFLTTLSLICVASYLAFLKYNFYPAKIFMGDSGSLFIGYFLAAISIYGNKQYKGITAMTLLIPIISLFIPLMDTVMAVFRRIKKGNNIFIADKLHYHHKMLEFGFTQDKICIISYFITFLFGLIAFGFTFAPKQVLILIFFLLAIILTLIFYNLIRRS